MAHAVMAIRRTQLCTVPKSMPDRIPNCGPLQPARFIKPSCHASRCRETSQIKPTADQLRPPILHNHQKLFTRLYRVRAFANNLNPRWHRTMRRFLRYGASVIFKPTARHKPRAFCAIQHPSALDQHANQTPITADQYIRSREMDP